MFNVSLSDGIGVAGIVLAIVIFVLDKAGRLKGNWLLALLFIAAVMTLFLALGNSWVTGSPEKWKLWRCAVMFCVVGFTYSGIAIWISGETEKPSSQPRESASPDRRVDLSLPIVVEIHVSNSHGPKEKFITIKNPGLVGIEDIQIEGIRYVFDRDSWKGHRLKLDFFSQLGVLATIPPIGPAKNSKPLAMGKIPAIKLYSFSEALAAQEPAMESEAARTYYCLRFTFRDERTKEKYAFYKVSSAFYGSPSFIEEEGTSMGGGVGHIWMEDVPEVIKAEARKFYKDQIQEYQP